MTFRRFRSTNLWDDTASGSPMDKVYVVQTNTEGHRALHADVHRPGRPGARSDVRLGHHGLRRRAVGPALDHDRHVAVALALARQRLMGAKFPYYLMADSVDGRAKEQEVTAKALPPAEVSGDIRHGFRLRARAAHHP